MIDINLIPPEYKKKKKNILSAGLNLPPEVVIGFGGGLVILLIIIHVLLLSLNISNIFAHKALKKEWEDLGATKVKVDGVVMNLRSLQSRDKEIAGISGRSDLLWAQKLNILSDSLPRSVWLKKVTLTDQVMFIEGSAVYRSNAKSSDIYTLISNLKKDKNYIDHFTELKLGPIQRRLINRVEIEDFSVAAKLK